MYELSGFICGLKYDFITGQPFLTLAINEQNDVKACVEELSEQKISVKIGKHREKRSLDANAYCWTLIGKLAEKLNLPVKEVYRTAIKEIGGNYEVVCVKNEAVEKLCSAWVSKGIGWQTDTIKSKLDGCTNVILYYGSSTYDTKQMSLLIDNIVEDCKAQGIETKTPAELAELKSLWNEKNKQTKEV